MNTATIGPTSWRNNTLKEIKLSNNVVNRSDRSCEHGRATDPLPHLRDTVAELSNEEAHRYFRQTRQVVCQLRESLLDTNEEIKSLTRGKEALEKALEHIRKDLKLNQESTETRQSRPLREREQDGADDLLHAERQHLLNLKKTLEAQLQLVQQQLQVLDSARRRLFAVIQERNRVLDLVCSALPSTTSVSASGGLYGRTAHSGYANRSCTRMSADSRMSMGGSPHIEPLGPYTPEADQALQGAKDARGRSAMLRSGLQEAINKVDKMQKSAHRSVNSGLTAKVAETVTLKQHLQVAKGENRHALHRAQRWYDNTEKAWGYTLGPVSSSDISTRERLERPIISVYQRHPGTNLPEAQEIVKGGNGLLQSLTSTSRNIGMLKLASLRLKDDIRDKNAAINVDGAIVRMRRKKANHRWAMGEAF